MSEICRTHNEQSFVEQCEHLEQFVEMTTKTMLFLKLQFSMCFLPVFRSKRAAAFAAKCNCWVVSEHSITMLRPAHAGVKMMMSGPPFHQKGPVALLPTIIYQLLTTHLKIISKKSLKCPIYPGQLQNFCLLF